MPRWSAREHWTYARTFHGLASFWVCVGERHIRIAHVDLAAQAELDLSGRSAPAKVDVELFGTGGTPAAGWTQFAPPVTAVTLALALATKRPTELKQMDATAVAVDH